MNVIKKYAEEIKKVNKDIIVCVGGVHAEVCPEDFRMNVLTTFSRQTLWTLSLELRTTELI